MVKKYKVGDKINHPKYGKGVVTFEPGSKAYLSGTYKADFGSNKGQPFKIPTTKKRK